MPDAMLWMTVFARSRREAQPKFAAQQCLMISIEASSHAMQKGRILILRLNVATFTRSDSAT
jgi:hypothetical protein